MESEDIEYIEVNYATCKSRVKTNYKTFYHCQDCPLGYHPVSNKAPRFNGCLFREYPYKPTFDVYYYTLYDMIKIQKKIIMAK
jgi:hypothetical protein